jgi:4-hydroxy-tetrahydrodipicolinate synthase
MFKGSIPALVTPFKNGAVDFDALKRLVEWHIAQGSHGLVPVGTTGESPTLSHDEHEQVVQAVVDTVDGRIPVIAGAGSNSTSESLGLVKHAKAVGADAALVVTPYYNKPTQAGMVAHYSTLAEVGLPIFIYNIPPRSVVDMSPETMGELAKLDMIVGVKDSSADPARVAMQRMTCGKDFIQLCAEDPAAVGYNAMGGVGCISVTANVAPQLCSQMQEATLAGDFATALEISDKVMPLHRAIFLEPGVAGVKYAMSCLGLCENELRLPMISVSDDTKATIEAALRHAGLLN